MIPKIDHDAVDMVFSLLERRNKQLARVLRTARRDGDVLRDMAMVMFGKHGLSQAGIIRMFDQYMELTRRVVTAVFPEGQNGNGSSDDERTESVT